MEAELMVAALAMKEAVCCSNMMKELGLGTGFDRLQLYIDNTSVLHVAGNRTYSSRIEHVALRYFFIQDLVKERQNHDLLRENRGPAADKGTKHLNMQRQRDLFKLISEFKA